jgi:aminopeptidase 2
VPVKSVAFDEGEQRVTLTTGEPLLAGGEYEVRIRYRGILNDKLAGFYRSQYT